MISININGIECTGYAGQTVLDIALEHGFDIPTLCHDERVQSYGACGVCVVELEGAPRLVRACSTMAQDGMAIKTDTKRIHATRQNALELMLSDHVGDCRPPCAIACPAQTDCQGYVGLIANGQYYEALELIKDKIPLPASIGRVCPHPCETACRREMVEEPIGIAHLKAFVADEDLASGVPFMPVCLPATGKSVAIVGGGPGGLSAAYFLAEMGHTVTIYDSMPKMGGMLRYGIPEYRLPKKVLDAEIALIADMGVMMVNDVKIGQDLTLDKLRTIYDAVLVAAGAWKSMPLGCPGENLNRVIGGIDFLREVSLNNPIYTGKNVAVVGGGNTAMDACRTAVRLGAANVYNIYRRTKNEMPAEKIEILEAEEEGVIFKNLTNPIEVLGGSDGAVEKVRLQIMELGEPDASGRRRPVPVAGQEETLEIDTLIVAIGQGPDLQGLESLAVNKWGNVVADEKTFRTNLEGVFAVGDLTNNGASIAVEAIGEAQKASEVINSYLCGEFVGYEEPYLVTQEVTKEKFAYEQKISREGMPHLKPDVRRDNFREVNFGYSIEQAEKEASRCLECGCADYFECKLIDYAQQYNVKPQKFAGQVPEHPLLKDHPFIQRNPNKCILCGLCVRVCDEVMGRSALGLVGRGFDTVVTPALHLPLSETDCISCGQCVALCPTGAMDECLTAQKPVPTPEEVTESTCAYCSVGCQVNITSYGDVLKRHLPEDMLCVKGRFGFGELEKQPRVVVPNLEEACLDAAKKAQGIIAKYGPGALAVAVSDKYTNEEIFVIKEYANEVLGLSQVYSFGKKESGLKAVLGKDASTTTFDECAHTDVIVLVADDIINSHTIAGMHIKKAVENGAKLILFSNKTGQADEWATIKINPGTNLDCLKGFVKAVTQIKGNGEEGFGELCSYLKATVPTSDISKAAELYADAKKAIIMFDDTMLSKDAAILLADAAVCAGHIGKARSGIIALKANNNSQGLVDMGIEGNGAELTEKVKQGVVKGMFIFGEDISSLDTSNLELLVVQDYLLTETAEKAHILLPAATAAESQGTYTSTDGTLQEVRAARPPIAISNIELIKMLANISVPKIIYECTTDVQKAIEQKAPAEAPAKAKLCAPTGDSYTDETVNTHGAYISFVRYLQENGLIKN